MQHLMPWLYEFKISAMISDLLGLNSWKSELKLCNTFFINSFIYLLTYYFLFFLYYYLGWILFIFLSSFSWSTSSVSTYFLIFSFLFSSIGSNNKKNWNI